MARRPYMMHMIAYMYAQCTTVQNIHTLCGATISCVFLEQELPGFSPNFHIHVSVAIYTVYIPMIRPPIFLQQNMQTNRENI
jgi:hypothetical protein